MLMSLFAVVDREIQKTQVVFDIREITSMLCLLKVITRSSLFYERTIEVVSRSFRCPKIFEHVAECLVITTFECLVVDLLKQRLVIREKRQCFTERVCVSLHDRGPQYGFRL